MLVSYRSPDRNLKEVPLLQRISRIALLAACLTGSITVIHAQSPPTTLISVNRFGNGSGNQASLNNAMSMSANGRFVAFVSDSSNIVVNDTNNTTDVFVRDRQTGQTILVSMNAAGTGPGNQFSRAPTITPDGRFVVFISASSNLVNDDAAQLIHEDVYIRDLQSGTTRLVSRNATGNARGNGSAGLFDPLGVSDDGRFVVFTSVATDLTTTPDNNNQTDVFVRDLQTNTTKLVSINQTASAAGDGHADLPVITPDGRFVAFRSNAKDLVALNIGFRRQVFVRDLQTNTTKLVTPNRFGNAGGNGDVDPVADRNLSISANGRFIAYVTDASDMVANDTNNSHDIFVRDTQLETTSLVGVDRDGFPSLSGYSGQFRMTPDGRFVVFISGSDSLVNNDVNQQLDVFVRDLQTNTTTLITVNQFGSAAGIGIGNGPFISEFLKPTISDDGRYVSFISHAGNLANIPDNNGVLDVFVRDRQTSVTTLASPNHFGSSSSNGFSGAAGLSRDGSAVCYFTDATDLLGYDSNGATQDIYLFLNVQQPGQVRFKFAVTEGTENGTATVTVTKVGPPGSSATVGYSTIDGTATSGIDYTPAAGTLVFGPADTEKTFIVSTLHDTLDENDETIMLNLSSANTPVPLGEPSLAVIKIVDDDPSPTLRITDVVVPEGEFGGFTPAIFDISLSTASGRTVIVTVTTQAGTATSGQDFTSGAVTLFFAPGETLKKVLVFVTGDHTVENHETFFVNLINPVNAVIGDGQATGTIVEDDALLLLTETDAQRAIALDSVTWLPGPFSIVNNVNFSTDHRTRISLFGVGFNLGAGGNLANLVTATAEDSQGKIHPLTVEFVANIPAHNWITQVVVKLNDQITVTGDLKIKLTYLGSTSNTVLVAVKP